MPRLGAQYADERLPLPDALQQLRDALAAAVAATVTRGATIHGVATCGAAAATRGAAAAGCAG